MAGVSSHAARPVRGVLLCLLISGVVPRLGAAEPWGNYVEIADSIGPSTPAESVSRSFITVPRGSARLLVTYATGSEPVCAVDWRVTLYAYDTVIYSDSGGADAPSRVTRVLDVSELTTTAPVEFSAAVEVRARTSQTLDCSSSVRLQFGQLPGLQRISFKDWEQTTNALPLRIDEDTEIARPEWEYRTRDKAPGPEPYDSQTSGPAAYIAGERLKMVATFRAPANWEAVTIGVVAYRRDGTRALEFERQTVEMNDQWQQGFAEAVNVPFVTTEPLTGISADDLTFRWRVYSVRLRNGELPITLPGYFEGAVTHHRIYTLRRAPVSPMKEPWALALELSSALARTLTQPASDAAVFRALAVGVYESAWVRDSSAFRFMRPSAQHRYTPRPQQSYMCGQSRIQNMDLTRLLRDLQELPVLDLVCADSANLLVTLAASQGLNATPLRLTAAEDDSELMTGLYRPAGALTQDCQVSCFTYHQVASLDGVYDPSAIPAVDMRTQNCNSDQSFFCSLAAPPLGTPLASYTPLLFPDRGEGSIAATPVALTVGRCQQ